MEMPTKATLIIPAVLFFYLTYCFIRFQFFGTTPREASAGTARFVAMLPRAPYTN
jgi:hypothetical protein